MLLKSRASLIFFRACLLPVRAKNLSAPRYSRGFEVLLTLFDFFILSQPLTANARIVEVGDERYLPHPFPLVIIA